MSRPFRFLFSAVFIASALSFAGCVGTIYDKTYSYNKTYFKSDIEDKKEASAETILGALDTKPAATGGDAAVPPATDVPGLPAAGGLPAPDAGAGMPPAVPPPAAAPPQ